MFYNNQHPYPQQPYYPQNQEQQYREPQLEDQEPQQQEFQHQQNSYVAQQSHETQYQQNPYVAQQSHETTYQQNQYLTQQAHETQYQQNPYVAQQSHETQYQQNPYQQPQMYQPFQDPRVSPSAPTLDPTQPQILPPAPFDPAQIQILPPGPTTAIPTEPTQQQIQQVVGTQFLSLKKPVLDFVKPWVEYGMNEAKHTSHKHAMTEVAAIMFLIGKGFNPTIAHYIVESWEKNEQF
ncbi:hypothetical protein H9I32_27715 [Bacillus sp. Xin]|uniref:hypothetical protein n=1 Tax=unclassified Bacillus (in: firmicutes) TaxID=185979 RepID=UPI001572D978|nr:MULTISPECIES: hypothetical protein [unclassified Bacillus (in: firmicutes)]MBC6976021.1 hypothetical protein [Bacillus sp. Xin]NSW36415.1 hypothetical protein [Bacillus sp. Xin1]